MNEKERKAPTLVSKKSRCVDSLQKERLRSNLEEVHKVYLDSLLAANKFMSRTDVFYELLANSSQRENTGT